MSRHFCFCIPVRAAVFFFSLLTLLTSGLSAAVGWILVHAIETDSLSNLEKNMNSDQKQEFENLMNNYRIGVIVVSAVFTLIAVLSLFGFIGSIVRNRRMVKAYSYMTVLIFLFGSACIGFLLYLVWSHKKFCSTENDVETCVSSNLSTGGKIAFTVYSVVEWLIQLYIVVIIRRYYEQLEEEQEYRHEFRLNPTSGGTYEAKEGLMTQGHYPYSDSAHAFGKSV